ncbi:MAG: SIMPL domain-containing protein [Pseudomonadota bacterium]
MRLARRLAVALLAMVPLAPAALAQDLPPHMVVTGVGEVSAAPDMALVTVAVETEDRAAAEALRENSTEMAKLFEVVEAAGIAPADRQTRGLSLQTLYDNTDRSRPRIVGYRVRNTLSLRVRDLESLGGLLDTLVETGANRVEGIRFAFQDDAALIDAARRAAVADARAKATLYAEAAGVALGPILRISEAGAARPQPVMMERAALAAAPMDVPVAGGELTLSAQVTIIFGIEG